MAWWKFLLPKRASGAQLDSEMRFHIDELIDANIARGMPPGEARRQAMLEFGGQEQVKEEVRDVYRVRVIDGMENLSSPGVAEIETLGRLHLCASDVRLACQAILVGPRVSIQRLVPASAEDEEGRAPSEDRAAEAPVIS